MKFSKLMAGALALFLATQTPGVIALNDPGKTSVKKAAALSVDPSKSTLTWNAKKVGGEHSGNVKIAKGVINVESDKLVGGNFVMDMTSITDTDITNETFNKKLTDHLKSEDFFSVEKHPNSTFKITKAAPIANAKAGEANYTITGDLTIKGITNAVTFPAVVKVSGNSAEATAKFDIDRTKYDIKYRAAIIGTAADKIIEDTFTIDLKVVAGKTANNT
ncbi:YceI family protein [Rhodocytophaga aerolata]|uniref:YceI family protein n=1 Tax=Rhodocytophaga aerolata TaxID=455078 RepID=A0ABT8R3C8_9BACT|nr:YceI family protein [Rhodocytophaga aerolata]MDO1446598.1 YceI family protein [Rhodocytophaga aerolata]